MRPTIKAIVEVQIRQYIEKGYSIVDNLDEKIAKDDEEEEEEEEELDVEEKDSSDQTDDVALL